MNIKSIFRTQLFGYGLLFSSCAPYPGVFYAEHTQFGLQVKVNPRENKPVDVNMGYDRGTFTTVPRTQQGGEATAVLSKTDLCVRFVDSSLVRNVYASGNAAKNIGADGERVNALFMASDADSGKSSSSGSCD